MHAGTPWTRRLTHMGAQFSNMSQIRSQISRSQRSGWKHLLRDTVLFIQACKVEKKQKKPMQMLENLHVCAGHAVQKLPQNPRKRKKKKRSWIYFHILIYFGYYRYFYWRWILLKTNPHVAPESAWIHDCQKIKWLKWQQWWWFKAGQFFLQNMAVHIFYKMVLAFFLTNCENTTCWLAWLWKTSFSTKHMGSLQNTRLHPPDSLQNP